MASKQYLTRIRGEVKGPFTDREMQKMAKKGLLGRMHEISEDGNTWNRAEYYPQFFAVLTPDMQSRVAKPRAASTRGTDAGQVPMPQTVDTPSTGRSGEYTIASNQGQQSAASPSESTAPQPTQQVFPTAENHSDTPSSHLPSSEITRGQPAKKQQTEWFYTLDDEEYGPISKRELRELVESGAVQPYDQAWCEGMDEWMDFGNLEDIFPVSASAEESLPLIETAESGIHQHQVGSHNYYDRRRKPSMLAVASVVLAILPGFGITSIAAIITGAVAIQQINDSRGKLQGSGYALAGVMIGILSMLVWAVLLMNRFSG